MKNNKSSAPTSTFPYKNEILNDLIKAVALISFMLIIVPSGKFSLPILYIIILTGIYLLDNLSNEPLSLLLVIDTLQFFTIVIALFFILLPKKKYNLIGLALQFGWFIVMCRYLKMENIYNVYFFCTFSFFLIISGFLLYTLLKKKNNYNLEKDEAFSK